MDAKHMDFCQLKMYFFTDFRLSFKRLDAGERQRQIVICNVRDNILIPFHDTNDHYPQFIVCSYAAIDIRRILILLQRRITMP